MEDELRPFHFIDEKIQVEFDSPLVYEKNSRLPDRFRWHGEAYSVVEKMGEWVDTTRRGRMARNMAPAHAATASRRGSWGVGRYFFGGAHARGDIL